MATKDQDLYVQERGGEIVYKVIVIGDPTIGKTSLIRKFVQHQFQGEYLPTVGTQISKQQVSLVIDGKKLDFSILLWDLAGQPQFYMLHKVYYNGANGVILGFDLTRSHTFMNVKNWHAELVKYGLIDIPIILTGNKSDLVEERKVTVAHIDHMKEQLGIQEYIETSAKDGNNVNSLFETIARLIYEKKNH